MAKKKAKSDNIFSDTVPARYIDPQTDFGFKKLFGTEANKFVLQDFLQALLENVGEISSLKYLNTAQLGIDPQSRSAVYDIYCETAIGEKFIVEMQKAEQNYFKDRSVFYSTFPIQAQAQQGLSPEGKPWDFKLNAVYTIGILNFVFDEKEKGKKGKKGKKDEKDEAKENYYYINHVELTSRETKKRFYDKLTYVYVELPKFTKKPEELVTTLDKWIYVLKNLAVLDERPAALRERIFERLFRLAELEKLSPDEKFAYRESQKQYWDLSNVMDTAKGKVREEMMVIIEEKDKIIEEKDKIIEENYKNLEELKNTFEKKYAELEEKWEKKYTEQEEKHAQQEEKHAQQEEKYAQQEEKHAQQEKKHAEQEEKHAEQEKKHAEEIAELKRLINEKLT